VGELHSKTFFFESPEATAEKILAEADERNILPSEHPLFSEYLETLSESGRLGDMCIFSDCFFHDPDAFLAVLTSVADEISKRERDAGEGSVDEQLPTKNFKARVFLSFLDAPSAETTARLLRILPYCENHLGRAAYFLSERLFDADSPSNSPGTEECRGKILESVWNAALRLVEESSDPVGDADVLGRLLSSSLAENSNNSAGGDGEALRRLLGSFAAECSETGSSEEVFPFL